MRERQKVVGNERSFSVIFQLTSKFSGFTAGLDSALNVSCVLKPGSHRHKHKHKKIGTSFFLVLMLISLVYFLSYKCKGLKLATLYDETNIEFFTILGNFESPRVPVCSI